MPFKLTSDFIFGFLTEAAAGNPGPLIEAIDPEVRWRIGSEIKDDIAKTGIYVRIHKIPRSRVHDLEANEGRSLRTARVGWSKY